jgi:hypothetical protein
MIFVGILAIGLLSGRSKHFGFFALSVLMIFYLNGSFKMKLNFKNTFFIVAAIALTLFVARDKIYFYFIEGGFGKGRGETDLYARMALYFFAFKILVDYLPFGPGFGTYATFASGSYYSPIYAKYGMEKMHGLSKDAPAFIADTYYPALAQFGVVGVVLFFWFWAYWSAKALKAYNKGLHKESVISLIIIFFFIIECTSDATLTHNRGMFMMMMLGLINSDIHCKNINNKQLSENK